MTYLANRNRNPGIELYRILLMFGITLLHVAGLSQSGYDWLANLLHPCVTAFAFVSGWFGCRFRFRKLAKLYGTAIFCAVVMTTILMRSDYVAVQFGSTWTAQFFRMVKNYWFLHAYAVMMMFAPLVNSVVDRPFTVESKHEVFWSLLPVVVLSFGWSFAATFRCTESWMPRSSGFGAYTGLTLIGTYAVARYCRWSGCLSKIPLGYSLVIFAICCALATFKLGRYNSPVALLMAALTFKWAIGLRFQMSRLVRAMALLSPSMFSVYLLQVNDFMFPFIADACKRTGGYGILVVTVSVFVVLAALDLLRRLALKVFLFVPTPMSTMANDS